MQRIGKVPKEFVWLGSQIKYSPWDVRNRFLLHTENGINIPQIKQHNIQALETSIWSTTKYSDHSISVTPQKYPFLNIYSINCSFALFLQIQGDTKFRVEISFPHDCYKSILFTCPFIYFFQISLFSYSIFFIHPVSPLLYPKSINYCHVTCQEVPQLLLVVTWK